jgi:hypothetical protein
VTKICEPETTISAAEARCKEIPWQRASFARYC